MKNVSEGGNDIIKALDCALARRSLTDAQRRDVKDAFGDKAPILIMAIEEVMASERLTKEQKQKFANILKDQQVLNQLTGQVLPIAKKNGKDEDIVVLCLQTQSHPTATQDGESKEKAVQGDSAESAQVTAEVKIPATPLRAEEWPLSLAQDVDAWLVRMFLTRGQQLRIASIFGSQGSRVKDQSNSLLSPEMLTKKQKRILARLVNKWRAGDRECWQIMWQWLRELCGWMSKDVEKVAERYLPVAALAWILKLLGPFLKYGYLIGATACIVAIAAVGLVYPAYFTYESLWGDIDAHNRRPLMRSETTSGNSESRSFARASTKQGVSSDSRYAEWLGVHSNFGQGTGSIATMVALLGFPIVIYQLRMQAKAERERGSEFVKQMSVIQRSHEVQEAIARYQIAEALRSRVPSDREDDAFGGIDDEQSKAMGVLSADLRAIVAGRSQEDESSIRG